jgi:glutamine amidotransferase
MSLSVAVLDHGMGNLRSVAKALEAGGARVSVTSDPAEISAAAALCVPGQGIFSRCMANLTASGLDRLVRDWVVAERPYLGICLGMQILFEHSEEGEVDGLGILPGRVERLPSTVRVPHIGWNTVGGRYFYFDHSYAALPSDETIVGGWCEHGSRFAASVRTGSILAVQFHPEKSSTEGISLLRRWVRAGGDE